MYGVYTYIRVVFGGQWGGIYGSPIECLGLEHQPLGSFVEMEQTAPKWRVN